MSDPKLQIRAVASIAEVFIFVVMVLLLYWAACNGNGSVGSVISDVNGMPTSRWAIGVLQRFQTMVGHLRHANSSFFWILFFHSVFFLSTCATYWHSCDMHFVSRASHLAISYCIRVYHGLDAYVALCLSLRHEFMMQMRPSFPSANGVSREQFGSQGTSQTHQRRFHHCHGQSNTTLCGHIRRRSFAIFLVMVLLLYWAALQLTMYCFNGLDEYSLSRSTIIYQYICYLAVS
jgi:hypothetical protein